MSESTPDTASTFRDDNDCVVNDHRDADSQHLGGISPVVESRSRIAPAVTPTDVFGQDAAATFKEAVLVSGICDSGENSGRSEPLRTNATADGAVAHNNEASACPDVFRVDDKGGCLSVTTNSTFEHCQESSTLLNDSIHVRVPAANGISELGSVNAASSSVMEINPHEPRDESAVITVSPEQTLSDNSESSAATAFTSATAVLPPASEASAIQLSAPADGSGDAAVSLPCGSIKPHEQQLPTLASSAHSTCAELPESGVGQAEEAPATAENEDMDILGNGKLIKKVLKAGKGRHTRPQYGSQVSIRCQGVLPDGTVVDKSDGLSFILHDGDVIAALDLAVALMQLEEECELQVAPDYAYKGIGRHPDVPPDTQITYTVELLSVSEPPVISELPMEQVISLADRKRDRGNYLYSRTEYDNAIICYSRAVQIADDPGIQSDDTGKLQELLELRLKCYNNLAATQVKAKQYDAAVESCDKVLSIQPDNVKALFRKGKSLGASGSTKDAIEILKRALQLEPSTKVIHRELFKLQEKLRKDAENEKVLYQKMMGQKGPAADLPKGNQHRSIVTTYGLIGAAAAVALSISVFMLRKYL